MKVVTILGSPRKGSNSGKLAEAAVRALPAEGLKTETFTLSALKASGCRACFGCKGQSEVCVVKDDMAAVLAAVAGADLVILACPVYIGEVTAQMKTFIDRTFSYLVPDYMTASKPSRLAAGKKLLFILTQGVPDPAVYDGPVLGHYSDFMRLLGFEVHKFIAPGQGEEDITTSNPDLVKALEAQAAMF